LVVTEHVIRYLAFKNVQAVGKRIHPDFLTCKNFFTPLWIFEPK
jgi:hypothetical protein